MERETLNKVVIRPRLPLWDPCDNDYANVFSKAVLYLGGDQDGLEANQERSTGVYGALATGRTCKAKSVWKSFRLADLRMGRENCTELSYREVDRWVSGDSHGLAERTWYEAFCIFKTTDIQHSESTLHLAHNCPWVKMARTDQLQIITGLNDDFTTLATSRITDFKYK
ncbi:hypothetical protein P175DRAFT_0530228 [Aspergillus ochraceoroseus IBT 24754]|uniref:Uncharacterized protein n=1 Tax=Aspergillus ochraceoroseus IBT 24754 TaxID=1392256 RepID=A0A2T5M3L6_9EURO|nr:uncharacterized protein P175DRAFT_0530228 [Aspergillus ochraceoroseus IBT 24754]PTU23131.1 hypothetical protein P175DRAFT_0530228 [Aspergillus ochraceoroseus IBT 24754]